MNMNAAGIDVSKGRSIVALLRPYGEIVLSPFEIRHTFGNIQSLFEQIKSIKGESRIVIGQTGRYYEPLDHKLSLAGLFVTVVKLKLIKNLGNHSLRKVKSDAIRLARYTLILVLMLILTDLLVRTAARSGCVLSLYSDFLFSYLLFICRLNIDFLILTI